MKSYHPSGPLIFISLLHHLSIPLLSISAAGEASGQRNSSLQEEEEGGGGGGVREEPDTGRVNDEVSASSTVDLSSPHISRH